MSKWLLFIFFTCGMAVAGRCQPAGEKDPVKLLALVKKNPADTNAVQWLLDLSEYYIQQRSALATGVDSARLFAEKAATISHQYNYAKGNGNSCIALSRIASHQQKEEQSREYINQAIKVLNDAHLYTDLGYAYWELSGHYSLWTNESTQKIALIEKSVAAFHKAGNIKKEADALKELADVHNITSNSGKAMLELQQALELYQSIHEPVLQGLYDLMGSASCAMGNLKDAIQYGLLALQTAEKLKDTSMQFCTICNRLGITYFYLRDYNTSSFYYQKALVIAKKNKAYSEVYQITNNYGNNLIMLKRPADCNELLKSTLRDYPATDTSQLINYLCSFLYNYSLLKDLLVAKSYFNQVQSMIQNRKISDGLRRYVSKASIEYFFASGQSEKAKTYLEEDEKFLSGKGLILYLSTNQLLWVRYDSSVGDYKAAFRHFRKYVSLKDSIYSQEKSRYAEQLNIQFATAQKDQDLLLKEKNIELLQKEAVIKKAELVQANHTRNWMLAATVLLFVIIALLITAARIRQRINKKLMAKGEEIEKKNAALRRLVDEKEWLVKEIHHRVKNNFQIVQGLLGTQSGYLKSEEAINALAESRHRIQAMSLIHQKLYQSENLSAINMANYIYELTNYLKDSFRNSQAIQFKLEVEPVELDLSHCIPLGLILNEAITNAIKYAFTGRQGGIIHIRFNRTQQNEVTLLVQDNGNGLPGHINIENPVSMGIRLMKGLSEDIDAVFSIGSNEGTTVSLHFIYHPEENGPGNMNKKESFGAA